MFARSLTGLLLALSLFVVSLPSIANAQVGSSTAAVSASQYAKALAEIESKVEARRQALGIPGMSLAIVKDAEVIFIKGFGHKNLEGKLAATPDTQFAIGSTTKAMTALTILMSQDEGKLSLDDSPKKYLPYFRINDAEIDKNITIRDLLTHASGLGGTDLIWLPAKLTREEIIKVAGEAKPTAKFREKFQYQNVMFAAAGEVAAKVQKKPWEQVISERVFAPLGMTNSNFSVTKMQKAKDFSLGYSYDASRKETSLLPYRNIDEIGPAGSINSSARDMAEWLRFVLNGGIANGKRLVSEAGYAEWFKPQMRLSANGRSGYALGWGIGEWNGKRLVNHSGGIDGFNSMVAMLPDQKLGFVMLTNVSSSSLGGELMPLIAQHLLGENKPVEAGVKPPAASKSSVAGKYHLAEADIDIEIKTVGENLTITVPGQPEYPLEQTAPGKFKIVGLDGFAVTFKPAEGDAAEMFLEQPQGNFTLSRQKSALTKSDPKELAGTYVSQGGANVEIKITDGTASLNIPGQQPYTLGEKSADTYSLSPLPETYSLKPKRDAAGKITAFVVNQPEGEFEFKRAIATPEYKADITVDDLAQKTIQAIGGEGNWRKITSRVIETDLDMENQGVRARVTTYAKAPNKAANETTFTAGGKIIGISFDYFDSLAGEQSHSFAGVEKLSGTRLDDARLSSDFYSALDWRTNYKKVAITGIGKVGDEDAYIVSFEPKSGTAFKEYYSTKTYLLLKHDRGPAGTAVFSDYRDIDGIKLPFKIVNYDAGNGTSVNLIKSVKHNVPVEDKIFMPRKLK